MAGGTRILVAAGLVGSCATAALAQPTMYGFSSNGEVYRIDLGTGAGSLVGNAGVSANAAASDSQDRLFTMSSATQLNQIDPFTGAGSPFLTLTGAPVATSARGMAFDSNDRLFVAFSPADTLVPDTLGVVDMSSGAVTIIGSMIRPDIQALAFDAGDNLFGLGVVPERLYSIDVATGAATLIGGMGFGGDSQALEFAADGTLYGARMNLIRIDPGNGNFSLIGATGFADIRGLAIIGEVQQCYADCDTSTGVGVLDIFDFLCFGNRFSAGDPYACDCDTSTGLGVCDIFDFLCFGNAFNAGCP